MSTVVILLAVYNGEAFLQAFLQSLEQQTHTGWQLVWADDGSHDQSRTILTQFAARFPAGQVQEVTRHSEVHKGVAGAFLSLLQEAPEGRFVSFADQDDVWFPDKLERAVKFLSDYSEKKPALYCSRQKLVGADLAPLGLSPLVKRVPEFPGALTQNIATGCTVVLNPMATETLKKAANIPLPSGLLHDWWAYLVISAVGGEIIYDSMPSLLYRQHGGNTVGAQAHILKRGLNALKRGSSAFMQLLQGNLHALQSLKPMIIIAPAARQAIDDIQQALEQGSFLQRWRILTSYPQLRRQGRLETLIFMLWFLKA